MGQSSSMVLPWDLYLASQLPDQSDAQTIDTWSTYDEDRGVAAQNETVTQFCEIGPEEEKRLRRSCYGTLLKGVKQVCCSVCAENVSVP